jgi:hypothetical protein
MFNIQQMVKKFACCSKELISVWDVNNLKSPYDIIENERIKAHISSSLPLGNRDVMSVFCYYHQLYV